MKIGIGCITYNRPAHLEWWTNQVAETSPQDAVFHIASDTKERKGVAYRSNECLRELYAAGCDYIFLFNDDCAPIKKGWCDLFIDASNVSGQQHFIYQHETPGVIGVKSIISDEIKITAYNACNGCMLFVTRQVIEKVGGFSPNFGLYGWEHANYSNRIHAAGLSPIGLYACPAGAEDYIYSLDIDNHKPEWHKKLKHKGSMSPKEAMFHVNKNAAVYQRDQQLFYPL